ncbi:hypothetical protein ACHAPQ_009701 [Fusarium lateritium]
MPKRIIVCCDGTANDLRSDGTMWSNVGRIAECISEGKRVKQIVGYMSGIGTEGGRFRKMKDQATGYGLDQKILAAYGFICRHYEEGDSIVLIGFSRGAFIARCIVAFIGDVGVLLQPPLREKTVEGIYTEWTELMTSSFENTKRREILFVRYNSASEAKRVADGLALWDTVSSLHQSPPETYLDLVKTTPPWNVNYAFHALALEERRGLFKPDIWQGNYPTTVKSLKQCWFRGMHSHVGGSNEQWSNNLTNVSLSWIVSQLKENGLVSFEKDQLKRVFASDGTAKTKFQSRQDVGMKDSDNWLWRSLATFTGEKSGVRLPGKGTNEFLHWSIVSQPSQLLQPVPPMKLEIPLASWLPTEEATESEREAVRWPELYFYYTENRNMTPEEANGRLKVLQREIFGIERPDEINGGYLPLIRGERYCNAMSPSWLQTSSGETEGRFQVLDEVESQPQTLEQRPITTDAAYAGAPSASGIMQQQITTMGHQMVLTQQVPPQFLTILPAPPECQRSEMDIKKANTMRTATKKVTRKAIGTAIRKASPLARVLQPTTLPITETTSGLPTKARIMNRLMSSSKTIQFVGQVMLVRQVQEENVISGILGQVP